MTGSAGPSLRENLAGAWAVMLGRAEGLARMDLSLEGFWRSFGAVVLVAPFLGPALISRTKFAAEQGGLAVSLEPADLLAQLGPLLVDWFAFPLVFALLARPLGVSGRYVPYIVTRNWAAVIIVAGTSLIHAGHIAGLLPAGFVQVLLLVAVAVALRFSYVIARTALQVSPATALPIVIMDFTMSLIIWSAFERVVQPE